MCASYGAASEFNLLKKTYRVEFPPILAMPQQIIYPHTPAPVVIAAEQKPQVQLMNYSLIPSWSKVRKPKFATYNARMEEVLNKPSWKKPFETKHCLVPIQEFYEAVYLGRFAGHKIAISSSDDQLLTAAGIWDSWQDDKTGEVVDSFAILTTEPTPEILDAGHDRCPLFLKAESFDTWLTAQMSGTQWLEFLKVNQSDSGFQFSAKEPLKSYTGQMSLFSDDE
ncbi:SOS response-associated peptidase [Bdellovibrio sp. SKB1291214]|uniref:SOS response-associated peptidase n=1 Tax=Bdellovibrio sp. SKB1291214 TaxID=1732569 RepID=UPI002240D9F2|nr:SOS response-associated peptidase family protein [Bdellovibrio sp. SKB1291214]UYL08032.1 SOS response-associated peptidase [Bdellovibrio sp. SKB1291214]